MQVENLFHCNHQDHTQQVFYLTKGKKTEKVRSKKQYFIFFILSNFNETSRNIEELQNGTRKRLKPGKLSPRRLVPDHILKPPYVGSKKPPGIASGPELHDEKGIEYMRASGRLAAQVLQYAGTLVKVIDISKNI